MKDDQMKLANTANSRGGVLILVAILLAVFIGIAALAIDIGYLSTTRNELQNTADAAALAGAGFLGNKYIGLPQAQQGTYTFTKSEIEAVVLAVAKENRAAGKDIIIESADIVVGTWDQASSSIGMVTLQTPDAVYVKARRDNTANSSPISTFFAGIFGVDTMAVTAEAIASLSGPGSVAEGELITPFALSENVFPNCTDLIEFSPTTASCAAWHNFFDPINASNMEDKLWGFIEADADTEDGACEHCGDCQSCGQTLLISGPEWLAANFDISPGQYPDPEITPAAEAGVYFNFQGGAIASLLLGGYLDASYNSTTGLGTYDGDTGTVFDNEKKPAPMLALFDYFRYRDGDNNDAIWSTTVPVYRDETVQDESNDTPECDNANDNREILGFAKVEVIYPDPPPSTNIQVRVDCSFSVVDGRGGGGAFSNIRGTIPHLVK